MQHGDTQPPYCVPMGVADQCEGKRKTFKAKYLLLSNLGLDGGEVFLARRHGLLEADDLGYSVDHFLDELHLLWVGRT